MGGTPGYTVGALGSAAHYFSVAILKLGNVRILFEGHPSLPGAE